MLRKAIIDESKCYRWYLTRCWDKKKPTLIWVMLNPSTADGLTDDNTVNKVIAISAAHGYGSVIIINLFGFRTSSPRLLKRVRDPVGGGNIYWWRCAFEQCSEAVLAWGSNVRPDHPQITKLFRMMGHLEVKTYVVGKNKNGNPKHPCYLTNNTKLVKY